MSQSAPPAASAAKGGPAQLSPLTDSASIATELYSTGNQAPSRTGHVAVLRIDLKLADSRSHRHGITAATGHNSQPDRLGRLCTMVRIEKRAIAKSEMSYNLQCSGAIAQAGLPEQNRI